VVPTSWIYFIQFKFWYPQLHQHLCLHSTCHLNNKTYPLTPDLHWHQYLHLCILYWLLNSCITLYMLPSTPLHSLCTHFWHCIELLPTLLPQTGHGHLTAFCITFCHSALIITLVLFIFTLMVLIYTLDHHQSQLSQPDHLRTTTCMVRQPWILRMKLPRQSQIAKDWTLVHTNNLYLKTVTITVNRQQLIGAKSSHSDR